VKSLADGLPPEIAQQVHPDWRRNEREYWAVRDRLREQYEGQWIGFADRAVIASGSSPVDVFHRAQTTGLHPFVTCVGRENEPTRIRRSIFGYDTSYAGEPLPVISIELRTASGSPGTVLDRMIVDTGADATVLPWTDCQRLGLSSARGAPGVIGGVGGGQTPTMIFLIWAGLDGTEYPCRIHADFLGSERILGRDVLNQMEILFRGPSSQVVINP
jgi:predicted aspartyl protease